MAIPPTTLIRLPILQLLEDKKEHTLRETTDFIANKFNVSEEERMQLIPSRTRRTFELRVTWALSELRNTLLLENIEDKRGIFKITQRGLDVLKENPKVIDAKLLKRFSEYRKFAGIKDTEKKEIIKDIGLSTDASAYEIIEYNYNMIRNDLINELKTKIKNKHFTFFERLVVELLEKMGYGVGEVVGKSGDGGIDAVIKKDTLGVDEIYLQAKKYQETVPIKHVREFGGSIRIKKSQNAIFITTSDFSDSTKKYAEQAGIVLLDGDQLAGYMVDFDVGVKTVNTYKIKKIDNDYF